MKTKQFRCQHCRKICTARAANQKYCNKRECQQARKSSWGKEKYACDPDYRANQRVSTQAWLDSQGGSAAYYREYRKRRKEEDDDVPQAPEEERESDKREASLFAPELKGLAEGANRDAIFENNHFKSGRYIISPAHSKRGANRDAFLVEIDVISTG